MFSSELGNQLAIKSGTYGATYYHDSTDTVRFSLRSVGDYDVSRLAKIFGGGGHKNASGFKLSNGSDAQENGVIIWANESVSKPEFGSKGIDAVKT
jgi:nanoRNase/pAp phosphatase (c-di-AMP/oligoRNAs hydrolase)